MSAHGFYTKEDAEKWWMKRVGGLTFDRSEEHTSELQSPWN